jgi:hypothetical protein
MMRSMPPAPIIVGTPTYMFLTPYWPDRYAAARKHALLVLEIGFGHFDRRRSRRVVGRTGLEQADDLSAAVTGALHDLVELLLRVTQPILTRSVSGMPETVE